METIKLMFNKYTRSILLIIAGLLLGWLFFHQSPISGERAGNTEVHELSEAEDIIWTCAMHPQIRMNEPGLCPICGMDLIPLQQTYTLEDTEAVVLSESAVKLADIQTSLVASGNALKNVFLYGKIQPDERLLQSQAAHFPGRIESLYVNVTGETVKKGQLIARIYSPELVTAQKELLEALSLGNRYPDVLAASREKLRNWKLSEQQIQNIEASDSVASVFDFYANASGIVNRRRVNEGDYISKGTVLFDVVDLTEVWALFDAYESDLPWISLGQKVEFTTQALPGKIFEGKVSFIDPVMDAETRIAKVRVEIINPGLQLKPEMFISGVVQANLSDGNHPLTIPKSAVLWTGRRSIVYVKLPGREMPTFEMREIILGASTEDSFIVMDGLQAGEEIVTNGTFSVDASAQLAGKPSMMNQNGSAVSLVHDHSGMGTAQVTDLLLLRDVEMDETNPADTRNQGEIKESAINLQFTIQLTAVYSAYLPLKNAFVKSDPHEVAQIAEAVGNALDDVNMNLLSGESHMAWMDQLGDLKESLEKMIQNHDINIQREAFAAFNAAFYLSIKEFGLEGVTTYYQYCPMALNNTGAYWLSEIKEIRNPYFGEAMLTCGETRETMEY